MSFFPLARYRYAGTSFAPVATPTDFILIQGSATKIVWVKRIYLAGAATAAGTMPVQLAKRSTAGTVGSAALTAVAAVPCDSADDAATGVVSTVGTANYTTLGTLTGYVAAGRLQMTALATGLAAVPVVWDLSAAGEHRGVALRGVLQHLGINLAGAAIPSGGVIDYFIETEEAPL